MQAERFQKLKGVIGSKRVFVTVFVAIVLVGIFVRTYHFREWLYFYPDQSRDLMIASDFLNGKTSLPLMGPIAASTPFRIGPMYYYFQIASGMLFGVAPETMAYPDLFFGILSIPLLYYFLRRYFVADISMAMMALYAISFYAVRYSRFAWNPNPIPFFVLLFLLGLSEFLYDREKTKWRWIVILGLATGVGMQLHTILFLLLPATLFFASVYLLVKNRGVWRQIVAVLLISIVLNAGQLTSEFQTGFSNTRLLFTLSQGASENGGSVFFRHLVQNVVCNSQADEHILSSLGDKDECDSYRTLTKIDNHPNFEGYWIALLGVCLSVVFTVFGYAILVSSFRKEADVKRKYFLGSIILYSALSFVILFPVIDGINLRYFVYMMFVPFLFLGFLLQEIRNRVSRAYSWGVCVLICAVLAGTNISTMAAEARVHAEKMRSNATYVVLGEIEQVADSMTAQSSPGKELYLFGGQKYLQNYVKPLSYVLAERGMTLLRGGRHPDDVPAGKPVFFIGQSLDVPQGSSEYNAEPDIAGHPVENYRSFGRIGIYKLTN